MKRDVAGKGQGADRARIADFAWNKTVGAGNLEQERPSAEDKTALAVRLGRELNADDEADFVRAWARCVQEAVQP